MASVESPAGLPDEIDVRSEALRGPGDAGVARFGRGGPRRVNGPRRPERWERILRVVMGGACRASGARRVGAVARGQCSATRSERDAEGGCPMRVRMTRIAVLSGWVGFVAIAAIPT